MRRVDPRTGEVLERLEMPPGVGVSGLESTNRDQCFHLGYGPINSYRFYKSFAESIRKIHAQWATLHALKERFDPFEQGHQLEEKP
jgi:hypothetical protein